MTKADILKVLEDLPDDAIVVFNNPRFHVLEDISDVKIDEVHKVTKLGKKMYGNLVGEYIFEDDPKYQIDIKDEKDFGYFGPCFEREKTKVVILDWLKD